MKRPPRDKSTIKSAAPARFSKSVVWTVAARLLILAGSLGASVIVARTLGAEGLGALAVINVTVSLALQAGCAGLPSANTYFIAQDRKLLAPVWANALIFGLAAGSVLSIVVAGLAALRPEIFGMVSFHLIMLAAISIPFQLLTFLGLNVFLALDHVAQFNLLDTLSQVFVFVNALLALLLLGEGLGMLVAFNTIASILLSIIVVVMIGHRVREAKERRAFRPDTELFKGVVGYGIKFHLSVIAALIVVRADLLIVNHFRGAGEAGVYAVATQIASLIMILPGVISTLLFPRIVKEQDRRGELTMRVTRHTAFVMLIICLAAAPLGFALPLIYGAAFEDAPVQLLILLPGVFLIAVQAVLVQHFNSLGVPRAIPVFWLMTLLLNLMLNLLLVPRYGARAAAASSTVAYTMIFLLISVYFIRQTGNRLSQTFVLRADELRGLLRMHRPGISTGQEA